jgi:TonB family protein
MRLNITALEVVLAATAFALACNLENVQEVPTKTSGETLESKSLHSKREQHPKAPARVPSEVGEMPVEQGYDPAQAVEVGTKPSVDREELLKTENGIIAPTQDSLAKVEDSRVKAPKARNKKRAPVQGSLSKEVIRRRIREGINHVRNCFEEGFERNPCLGLLVVVKFIISPKGNVRKAWIVRSETGDRKVDKCVLRAVRKFEFPAPEGGGPVVVTYPFHVDYAGDNVNNHCVRQ